MFRTTFFIITNLIHIKLVIIKELYYDARPTKSQDLHCKTSKTDISVKEDQNKIVQKQCGHLVQQNLQD